jgi:uncharacterized protein (TIGR03000 family)
MNCCVLSWRRSSLAWTALLLAGSPAWGQGGGGLGGFDAFPSSFRFGTLNSSSGPTSYGTNPGSYAGGLQPYSGIGTALKPLPGTFFSSAMAGQTLAPLLGEAGALPSGNSKARPDNRARIWLRVPANAEVWFEGVKTRQSGTERYFYSPPLTPGLTYAYEVEARWKEEGKVVKRQRQIVVHAGDTVRIDFNP